MFQVCDVLQCFYSIGRIIHVALTLLSPKLFFWLFEKFKVKNLSLVFGSLFDTMTDRYFKIQALESYWKLLPATLNITHSISFCY